MSEQIDKAKAGIIAEHRLHDTDTGSPEVQIAILTKRINHLNEHLQKHKTVSYTHLTLPTICSV